MAKDANKLTRGMLPFLLLISSSLHFAVHYVWDGTIYMGLAPYAFGMLPMPYQGRVLMAWVLHATVGQPSVYRLAVRYTAHLPSSLRDPYVAALIVIVFASVVTACLACRSTIRHLGADAEFADWSCLLLLGMVNYVSFVAINNVYFIMPYDIPSIAFFSLGIWAVLRRRYGLLTVIFVLGTLNRETYIFITLFLVLYAGYTTKYQGLGWRSGVRSALPSAITQLVFWIAAKVWLVHHFSHNILPNNPDNSKYGVAIFQLQHNIHFLRNPFQWPLLIELAAVLALPLALGRRWIADPALTQATAIVMACWTVGMLFVGIIIEVRVFYELTAFVAPCIASMIWTRLRESGPVV